MSRPNPSRPSSANILRELRTAAKKGDRAALTLAIDQMRTLALSPRYWQKYLGLLRNPFARLVDLLVIKQGERIAHQKGWKISGGRRRADVTSAASSHASPRKGGRRQARRAPRPSRPPASAATQPSLFEP